MAEMEVRVGVEGSRFREVVVSRVQIKAWR